MANARDALWESGHDETVEVNQRALIDKVLARYSGEFTVFRELLQNSDDAGANAVEIRFETKEYLESQRGSEPGQADDGTGVDKRQVLDRKASLVHQWSFKNNGMVFRDEDWNRLKKIAEGNPDEEKIGAFGVGFYSLFSITEEPFVTSGGQWMGFYWKDKKDQLFARRGKLPDSDNDLWTTFEMFLRGPAPIPGAFDLTRFLASSITFMTHLSEVSVYLDDKCISKLSKDPGAPKSVDVPRGLKNSSPKGIMEVTGIKTTPLSIRAYLMRWVYMAGSEKPRPKGTVNIASTNGGGGFFSSLFSSLAGVGTPQRSPTPLPASSVVEEVDPTALVESSVTLSVFVADIGVKVDRKLKTELIRATKKNPPTHMRLELIYTGKDEYDASKREDEKQPEKTGSIFQGLRADIEGTGTARIFIGHATGQTTGLGGHIAARFIPTVERESIDLMDRTVAVWNEELLFIGGFLARAAYELEMNNIHHLWTGAAESMSRIADSSVDEGLHSWLCDRAVHALKFFSFRPSTPSSLISTKLEAAFFSCGVNEPFPIISTAGVKNAADVRVPNLVFAEFLKELPVLPEAVFTDARRMVGLLRDRAMIKDIEFLDVLKELRSRPLSETEMLACFRWWIGIQSQDDPRTLARIRTELLNAAVLYVGEQENAGGKIIPMSSIMTFLNSRGIGAVFPLDGPLPAHLLPVGISKHLDAVELSTAFPFRELSILDWLRHVADPAVISLDVEHDITKSAQWAERVLQVLSRAWPSLPKDAKEEVAVLLQDKTCVPTTSDMKMPREAYFQTAHVFHDLPIIYMPSGSAVKGSLEKVLEFIGVRKHVDLQVVFNRMIKTGDWTIAELVKYLVAVRATLTPLELERLQMTAVFPKETGVESGKEKVFRYKAGDLYEPLGTFRELGLPIIDWGRHLKWRGNSEEARFLFGLGLRRFPPLSVLLSLAASPDQTVRSTAIKYFLDNISTKYVDYDPAQFSNLEYIPAIKEDAACTMKPFEVFASPVWATLGFAVVDSSLRTDALSKLKINEHPSTSTLMNLLERSPPSMVNIGRQWFSALATRVSDFSPSQLKTLSQLAFVPWNAADGTTRMLSPSQCYFIGDSKAQFHSKLFIFVDFGTQANHFLSACGTKHEPSVEEIARILLENPRRFYSLADGRENYLIELRNIAVNCRLMSAGTIALMKRTAILLGSRRVRNPSSSAKPSLLDGQVDLEEDDWDYEYDLLQPEQVVVADDTNAYQLFGTSIFTAPQEDLLEAFYLQLGSKLLSSLIREEYRTTSEIRGSRKAIEIRTLILERLPLFLHEHTRARPQISFSWLQNEKNFVVRTFGKMKVIKSMRLGTVCPTISQDSSAIAKREGRGPIELWLAGNDQVDLYEVSTSMCRLLFESPKANDALLFMTILSTDLRALKRRGYNVDRILRQQQAHRGAQEEANREKATSTALVSQNLHDPALSPAAAPPLSATANTSLLSKRNGGATAEASPDSVSDDMKRMSIPPTMFLQSLDNWKRKFNGNASTAGRIENDLASASVVDAPQSSSPTQIPAAHPGTPQSMTMKTSHTSSQSVVTQHQSTPRSSTPLSTPRQRTPLPTTPGASQTNSQPNVTPRSTIAANISAAINACRQENSQRLQARDHMQMVEEALNEGYCDGTGETIDMSLIGEMGNIKIFMSQDVQDAQSVMSIKADSIARFIYVIRPLCEVYNLPVERVHIYYDLAGQRIGFNRNASIFLGLRYFEAWHDQAVHSGHLTDAYVSWYFTLAHEIAHNLVGPHNSEHEFYFSAISEAHIPALAKLLSSSPM